MRVSKMELLDGDWIWKQKGQKRTKGKRVFLRLFALFAFPSSPKLVTDKPNAKYQTTHHNKLALKSMGLKKRIKLCFFAMFVIAYAAILMTRGPGARAFSTGPDPGRTGAPGELTCATAECHGTARDTGPGKFSIIAPSQYAPGQTYQIIVRHLTDDLTRMRWGFQITALTGSNSKAGEWRNLSEQTRIIEDNLPEFRRQYAEHSDRGTFPGQTGVASWTIDWTGARHRRRPHHFLRRWKSG